MSSHAAELEAELRCSICLTIYRDPVLLPCGHNFCRGCLDRAWESRDMAVGYSCPECRAEFREHPVLQRNIKLANIVEHFQIAKDHPPETKGPLPEERGDSTGDCRHPETVEQRRTILPVIAGCPEHGLPWEYFCRQHKTCLCQTCRENHQSHSCQSLEKAAAERRAVLAEEIERLEQARNVLQGTVGWLEDSRGHLTTDRGRLKDQVSGLFHAIQEMISEQEQSVLDYIDSEENLQHARLDACIREIQSKRNTSKQFLLEAQELEQKDLPDWEFIASFQKTLDKLLKADIHIQGYTLMKREMDRASVKLIEKEGQAFAKRLSKMIQDKLSQGKEVLQKHSAPRAQAWRHKGKVQIVPAETQLQRAKLTLDPNTAHCNLSLSEDLLSAEWTEQRQANPPHPERFRLHPQVLCAQGFSTGQHWWEVALVGARRWEVGATCKKSNQSWVDSCIAWALRWNGRRLQAFEGTIQHSSSRLSSMVQAPGTMRVCLDCERGTLSFFALEEDEEAVQTSQVKKGSENRTLLHTFHIKPIGPVFPGFYLEQSKVRILKHNSNMDALYIIQK
ncbi:E3 ubiquitin-protein ligase TRIM7-like [Megalops cyprinoides]|uniref:E3 ubiquitin-protein ligase TRIM7-like n=1 Tax=Megalops cyprinoides TaxID=118141 RepID=UPI0018644CAC|nr:E3 ubiquitin-protein ligase TRIM7-like [Megalops cyprinoides]